MTTTKGLDSQSPPPSGIQGQACAVPTKSLRRNVSISNAIHAIVTGRMLRSEENSACFWFWGARRVMAEPDGVRVSRPHNRNILLTIAFGFVATHQARLFVRRCGSYKYLGFGNSHITTCNRVALKASPSSFAACHIQMPMLVEIALHKATYQTPDFLVSYVVGTRSGDDCIVLPPYFSCS